MPKKLCPTCHKLFKGRTTYCLLCNIEYNKTMNEKPFDTEEEIEEEIETEGEETDETDN